jgi:hypothetical protein
MNNNNIYNPYVYHISWSNQNKHYIGVRFRKGCNPSDLWVSYFTSSKHVKKFREEFGEPDLIEILETFTNADDARSAESKYIQNFDAVKSKDYLNKHNPNEKWFCEHVSEETRNKMSRSALKRVKNGTHHFLELNRKLVEAGTHCMLGGEIQRKLVEDGKHHFLGPKVNRKRVEAGTHNFLGGEIQRESTRRRVVNGTHNFLNGNNPTIGTIWVYNENENKRIRPDKLNEFIEQGYKRGMKTSYS